MNGPVLLVTADPLLVTLVRACVLRAGAWLEVRHTLIVIRKEWRAAQLVLLGADLAYPAYRRRMPPLRNLMIVTAATPTPATEAAARHLHAIFLAHLPDAQDWLADRLADTAENVVRQLTGAGYRISYTDPDTANTFGQVTARNLRTRRESEEQAVYVSFSRAAAGPDQIGQVDTVQRSNYRTAHRLWPNVWTDLVFADGPVLGAFVADLPPAVVDAMCQLSEYPLLDDDDHGALQHEEIAASWRQWAADDVYRLLRRRAADAMLALDADDVEQLWWRTINAIDAQAEHTGVTVRWDYPAIVPAFAARLLAEVRRGPATRARYRIHRHDDGTADGQWRVRYNGQQVAAARTRLDAQIAVWHHHHGTTYATPTAV
ncbi:hypothetical protein [Catenuloplanes japonicus]|uniref:hypothetical protein n=1 Tax=Catenuloplanes japonicus TaxID=33876 RepID=UPI0012FCC0D5|nr:hypothetical protein [Catenuloplanes japonicus]